MYERAYNRLISITSQGTIALINKIKNRKNHGRFYKFTWDRVIMYPMIEMAGKEHFYPVRRPLYIYNVANPISVDRVHRYDQLRIESELKQKQQYNRIDSLYD